MGEPTVIMYDKPRPGPRPLNAQSLSINRPPTREERAFLMAYREAPGHGIGDIENAKRLLCAVLSLHPSRLESDPNFSTAMDFVMGHILPPKPAHEPAASPFMNREGGADAPALVRPLKPGESRFLASLSVAPGYTDDEVKMAKALLAEVLGIPCSQLECPRAYTRAMDSVLQLA